MTVIYHNNRWGAKQQPNEKMFHYSICILWLSWSSPLKICKTSCLSQFILIMVLCLDKDFISNIPFTDSWKSYSILIFLFFSLGGIFEFFVLFFCTLPENSITEILKSQNDLSSFLIFSFCLSNFYLLVLSV